jgi:molybdate transport system substrate-binding protein
LKIFTKLFRLIAIMSLAAVFHSAAHAESVNVFAAASLKTALDDIATVWKTQSGKDIVATYGSTATLAKQIAEAAPADIFISADLTWMDDVATKNLIKPDSRKNLVGNTLVLVGAAGTDLKIDLGKDSNLAAALGAEKLAVGDVKSVPAGKYAKAALESLGLWTSVETNLVMQENVRAALALVARGEAKLGIVYGSDAVAESKVQVVANFPETSHKPILYPAAVIAASTNPEAQPFLDFLSSRDAQLIFKKNGFTLLE